MFPRPTPEGGDANSAIAGQSRRDRWRQPPNAAPAAVRVRNGGGRGGEGSGRAALHRGQGQYRQRRLHETSCYPARPESGISMPSPGRTLAATSRPNRGPAGEPVLPHQPAPRRHHHLTAHHSHEASERVHSLDRMTSWTVDGHQDLPTAGHEVEVMAITESDRICWSPRRQSAPADSERPNACWRGGRCHAGYSVMGWPGLCTSHYGCAWADGVGVRAAEVVAWPGMLFGGGQAAALRVPVAVLNTPSGS